MMSQGVTTKESLQMKDLTNRQFVNAQFLSAPPGFCIVIGGDLDV
jgi:hypothetical protein